MPQRPRILFVSHSASRNGASLLLLHILQWLRPRVNWDIDVLIDGRGPLVSEFRSLARTRVLRDVESPLSPLPSAWRERLQPLVRRSSLRLLFGTTRFDLVYANTCSAWPLVEVLRPWAPHLVWHVHELRYALKVELPDAKARQLLPTASKFIAVSRGVKDTLVTDYGVSAEKVEVIPGFVDVPAMAEPERVAARARLLEQLGWPRDAFVVGGCGSLGWRKGTDLFLQIARRMQRSPRLERIRFLWVGGGADDAALQFDQDHHALDLGDRCIRLPARSDALDYYRVMDCFALTSREDPFPLVMLEAGATGLPVVCFSGAGGGPDFVGDDAGLIASAQDIEGFGALLERLYGDVELRRWLAAGAEKKAREIYTRDVQAAKIVNAIQRVLELGGAATQTTGHPV